MLSPAEDRAADRAPDLPAMPLDGPYAYKVEFLGVTCGHMTLESRLEIFAGRPAYHIIMTGRNSRFFNKIYRVDGRVDSWVDAETMTTLEYESVIVEKGKRKVRRYHVDSEAKVVKAEKHGNVTTLPFDGEPSLDPLAFVVRARVLAGAPGTTFGLRLLTDKGPFESISQVGKLKRFETFEGDRELLRIQPMPVDRELSSRKEKFVMWVDPGPRRTLHRLEFFLSFGSLVVKLTGPAGDERPVHPTVGVH